MIPEKRDCTDNLKLQPLKPRLMLTTDLFSTLVSMRGADSSQSLLRPGATVAVAEGAELAASVRLTRRPNSGFTVTFKGVAPFDVGTYKVRPANGISGSMAGALNDL